MFVVKGFTGAYNTEPTVVSKMIKDNSVNSTSTSNSFSPSRQRRSLLAVSSTNPDLSGINNPTTCLLHNDVMMFSVTNDYYPQYDENNLYNTNPDFDFGAFKDLAEKLQLMGTNLTLFAFRFQSPGVYAFKLSTSVDQRMVRLVSFIFLCNATPHTEVKWCY